MTATFLNHVSVVNSSSGNRNFFLFLDLITLCVCLLPGELVLLQSTDIESPGVRLYSFKGWKGKVPAYPLAHAGFIYRKIKDQAQCVSCHLAIERWVSYDEGFLLHKHYSPSCKFTRECYTIPTFLEQEKEFLEDSEMNTVLEHSASGNEQAKQCKICYSKEMCIMFLPCSHLLCCRACASRIDSCPLCCDTIVSKHKVYIAF